MLKDEGQDKAVSHREGAMRVVACAGSGKTSTIARRIAAMVRDGIERDKIVALTFNDMAAAHLKKKIRREMEREIPDDPSLGQMFVGTIHSFAFFILKEYDPKYRDFDVLDDSGRWAFLQNRCSSSSGEMGKIIRELAGRARRHWIQILWSFLKDADLYRIERPTEPGDDATSEETETFRLFKRLFDLYRQEMERDHFIDYAEMLYAAHRMLSNNPDILAKVRKRYEYFIVDEFQDTDPLQYDFIRLLVEEAGNLMAVGDDDQCIYRWRGTRPELFIRFLEDFPDAEEAKLDMNYRSTDTIVKAAERLIGNNTNRIPKSMKARGNGEYGDVYRASLRDRAAEQEFVADRIRYLNGKEWTANNDGGTYTLGLSDMAILFRKHREMERFAETLQRHGIEFNIQDHGYVFFRPRADLVRYAFAYIAGTDEPMTIKRDASGSRFSDNLVHVTEDVLREAIERCGFQRGVGDRILDWCKRRRVWLRECDARRKGDPKGRSSVGWMLTRRIFPQDLLREFYNVMGIKGGDFSEALMADLAKISKCFKDFEGAYHMLYPDQLRDLVIYLDEYVAVRERGGTSVIGGIEAVNLLTIHQAKGLEFPVVFVPGTDKRSGWGIRRNPGGNRFLSAAIDYSRYDSTPEDERRLFYVAVTRSEKFLFITHPSRTPYGNGSRNANPVDYFDEFDGDGILDRPLADPTQRSTGTGRRRPKEEPFPTTYSDISYYFGCPYDYYLRKVLGFCPPISPFFGYGKQVHKLLRRIHERFEEGTTSLLPSPGEIGHMVEDEFYMRYLAGDEETRRWKERAKNVLLKYVSSENDGFGKIYKAEIPFEVTIGNALVSGSIDLLEKYDKSGKLVGVDIVDFKTYEMPNTEWDPKILDAETQVALYAIAVKKALPFEPHQGRIKYLRPDKKVQRREVDLSENFLQQTKQRFLQAVDAIQRREFPARPAHGIKCEECDWMQICRHCDDTGKLKI